MDSYNHRLLKVVHKFIRRYPGKYTEKQILMALDIKNTGLIDHLKEMGCIRETSGQTFITIKPIS